MDGFWDVPHSLNSNPDSDGDAGRGRSHDASGGAKRPRKRLSVFRLSGRRVAAALPSCGEDLGALLSPLRDALGPEVRARGVPGLFVIRDFVSESEEQSIVDMLDGTARARLAPSPGAGAEEGARAPPSSAAAPGVLWDSTLARRVCHFGARFDYVSRGIAAEDVRKWAGREPDPLAAEAPTRPVGAILGSLCKRAEDACRGLARGVKPTLGSDGDAPVESHPTAVVGGHGLASAETGTASLDATRTSACDGSVHPGSAKQDGAGDGLTPQDPWLVPTWELRDSGSARDKVGSEADSLEGAAASAWGLASSSATRAD